MNVDTLLSFMEDKLSTEYSVMDSLKKVKKTLHKMDGEAAQEEVGRCGGEGGLICYYFVCFFRNACQDSYRWFLCRIVRE